MPVKAREKGVLAGDIAVGPGTVDFSTIESKVAELLSGREKGSAKGFVGIVASKYGGIFPEIGALRKHSPDTADHTQGVAEIVAVAAQCVGVDSVLGELMVLAALLHDTGKMGVRDNLLTNSGDLHPKEREEVRRKHMVEVKKILEKHKRQVREGSFNLIQHMVMSHHDCLGNPSPETDELRTYPRNFNQPNVPGREEVTREESIGALLLALADKAHRLKKGYSDKKGETYFTDLSVHEVNGAAVNLETLGRDWGEQDAYVRFLGTLVLKTATLLSS